MENNPAPTEPREVVYFTGTTPPEWAVEFCRRDLEGIRQFYRRFLGATEDQAPPLADGTLMGQALEIAKAFPDEHHARANMWRYALASLSPDQVARLVFPSISGEDGANMIAANR